VPAEHCDDGPLFPCRGCDRFDHPHEIAGYEDVGQCGEESREAAILTGRRGEFSGGNLVGPALYRNGANLRQVRFRRTAFTAYGFGDG
jgi:hypothetical protein